MNIVFLVSNNFSLRCLGLLLSIPDISLTGVVTAPRQFSISYRPQGVINVLHGDVQGWCQDKGVACEVITRGMKDEGLFESMKGSRNGNRR